MQGNGQYLRLAVPQHLFPKMRKISTDDTYFVHKDGTAFPSGAALGAMVVETAEYNEREIIKKQTATATIADTKRIISDWATAYAVNEFSRHDLLTSAQSLTDVIERVSPILAVVRQFLSDEHSFEPAELYLGSKKIVTLSVETLGLARNVFSRLSAEIRAAGLEGSDAAKDLIDTFLARSSAIIKSCMSAEGFTFTEPNTDDHIIDEIKSHATDAMKCFVDADGERHARCVGKIDIEVGASASIIGNDAAVEVENEAKKEVEQENEQEAEKQSEEEAEVLQYNSVDPGRELKPIDIWSLIPANEMVPAQEFFETRTVLAPNGSEGRARSAIFKEGSLQYLKVSAPAKTVIDRATPHIKFGQSCDADIEERHSAYGRLFSDSIRFSLGFAAPTSNLLPLFHAAHQKPRYAAVYWHNDATDDAKSRWMIVLLSEFEAKGMIEKIENKAINAVELVDCTTGIVVAENYFREKTAYSGKYKKAIGQLKLISAMMDGDSIRIAQTPEAFCEAVEGCGGDLQLIRRFIKLFIYSIGKRQKIGVPPKEKWKVMLDVLDWNAVLVSGLNVAREELIKGKLTPKVRDEFEKHMDSGSFDAACALLIGQDLNALKPRSASDRVFSQYAVFKILSAAANVGKFEDVVDALESKSHPVTVQQDRGRAIELSYAKHAVRKMATTKQQVNPSDTQLYRVALVDIPLDNVTKDTIVDFFTKPDFGVNPAVMNERVRLLNTYSGAAFYSLAFSKKVFKKIVNDADYVKLIERDAIRRISSTCPLVADILKYACADVLSMMTYRQLLSNNAWVMLTGNSGCDAKYSKVDKILNSHLQREVGGIARSAGEIFDDEKDLYALISGGGKQSILWRKRLAEIITGDQIAAIRNDELLRYLFVCGDFKKQFKQNRVAINRVANKYMPMLTAVDVERLQWDTVMEFADDLKHLLTPGQIYKLLYTDQGIVGGARKFNANQLLNAGTFRRFDESIDFLSSGRYAEDMPIDDDFCRLLCKIINDHDSNIKLLGDNTIELVVRHVLATNYINSASDREDAKIAARRHLLTLPNSGGGDGERAPIEITDAADLLNRIIAAYDGARAAKINSQHAYALAALVLNNDRRKSLSAEVRLNLTGILGVNVVDRFNESIEKTREEFRWLAGYGASFDLGLDVSEHAKTMLSENRNVGFAYAALPAILVLQDDLSGGNFPGIVGKGAPLKVKEFPWPFTSFHANAHRIFRYDATDGDVGGIEPTAEKIRKILLGCKLQLGAGKTAIQTSVAELSGAASGGNAWEVCRDHQVDVNAFVSSGMAKKVNGGNADKRDLVMLSLMRPCDVDALRQPQVNGTKALSPAALAALLLHAPTCDVLGALGSADFANLRAYTKGVGVVTGAGQTVNFGNGKQCAEYLIKRIPLDVISLFNNPKYMAVARAIVVDGTLEQILALPPDLLRGVDRSEWPADKMRSAIDKIKKEIGAMCKDGLDCCQECSRMRQLLAAIISSVGAAGRVDAVTKYVTRVLKHDTRNSWNDTLGCLATSDEEFRNECLTVQLAVFRAVAMIHSAKNDSDVDMFRGVQNIECGKLAQKDTILLKRLLSALEAEKSSVSRLLYANQKLNSSQMLAAMNNARGGVYKQMVAMNKIYSDAIAKLAPRCAELTLGEIQSSLADAIAEGIDTDVTFEEIRQKASNRQSNGNADWSDRFSPILVAMFMQIPRMATELFTAGVQSEGEFKAKADEIYRRDKTLLMLSEVEGPIIFDVAMLDIEKVVHEGNGDAIKAAVERLATAALGMNSMGNADHGKLIGGVAETLKDMISQIAKWRNRDYINSFVFAQSQGDVQWRDDKKLFKSGSGYPDITIGQWTALCELVTDKNGKRDVTIGGKTFTANPQDKRKFSSEVYESYKNGEITFLDLIRAIINRHGNIKAFADIKSAAPQVFLDISDEGKSKIYEESNAFSAIPETGLRSPVGLSVTGNRYNGGIELLSKLAEKLSNHVVPDAEFDALREVVNDLVKCIDLVSTPGLVLSDGRPLLSYAFSSPFDPSLIMRLIDAGDCDTAHLLAANSIANGATWRTYGSEVSLRSLAQFADSASTIAESVVSTIYPCTSSSYGAEARRISQNIEKLNSELRALESGETRRDRAQSVEVAKRMEIFKLTLQLDALRTGTRDEENAKFEKMSNELLGQAGVDALGGRNAYYYLYLIKDALRNSKNDVLSLIRIQDIEKIGDADIKREYANILLRYGSVGVLNKLNIENWFHRGTLTSILNDEAIKVFTEIENDALRVKFIEKISSLNENKKCALHMLLSILSIVELSEKYVGSITDGIRNAAYSDNYLECAQLLGEEIEPYIKRISAALFIQFDLKIMLSIARYATKAQLSNIPLDLLRRAKDECPDLFKLLPSRAFEGFETSEDESGKMERAIFILKECSAEQISCMSDGSSAVVSFVAENRLIGSRHVAQCEMFKSQGQLSGPVAFLKEIYARGAEAAQLAVGVEGLTKLVTAIRADEQRARRILSGTKIATIRKWMSDIEDAKKRKEQQSIMLSQASGTDDSEGYAENLRKTEEEIRTYEYLVQNATHGVVAHAVVETIAKLEDEHFRLAFGDKYEDDRSDESIYALFRESHAKFNGMNRSNVKMLMSNELILRLVPASIVHGNYGDVDYGKLAEFFKAGLYPEQINELIDLNIPYGDGVPHEINDKNLPNGCITSGKFVVLFLRAASAAQRPISGNTLGLFSQSALLDAVCEIVISRGGGHVEFADGFNDFAILGIRSNHDVATKIVNEAEADPDKKAKFSPIARFVLAGLSGRIDAVAKKQLDLLGVSDIGASEVATIKCGKSTVDAIAREFGVSSSNVAWFDAKQTTSLVGFSGALQAIPAPTAAHTPWSPRRRRR
jgi:hypothetical protein